MRRQRAMVDTYPGERVLIGETNLPSTVEIDKWYRGAAHNELQLPMDQLVGIRGASLLVDHPKATGAYIALQRLGSLAHRAHDGRDTATVLFVGA